ncbi:MAG: WD40 repeat domain-containing protein, partial [Planctomycetales bacterium]
IRLWDASTGEELHAFKGHSDFVGAVRFTLDGERVLSWDVRGRMLIWDLHTGELLFDGNVEEFPAGNDASRTPEGQWLALLFGTDIAIIDRAFQQTPRERQRRKLLARPKPRWHRKQFLAARSAEQWYASVFHVAWLLKLDPSNASLHDDLHEAHRQLLAAHNGQSPPLPAVVVEMLKLPPGTDLPTEANN